MGATLPEARSPQAFFIGLPQHIFWAIATLPHLAQRNPAISLPSPGAALSAAR